MCAGEHGVSLSTLAVLAHVVVTMRAQLVLPVLCCAGLAARRWRQRWCWKRHWQQSQLMQAAAVGHRKQLARRRRQRQQQAERKHQTSPCRPRFRQPHPVAVSSRCADGSTFLCMTCAAAAALQADSAACVAVQAARCTCTGVPHSVQLDAVTSGLMLALSCMCKRAQNPAA